VYNILFSRRPCAWTIRNLTENVQPMCYDAHNIVIKNETRINIRIFHIYITWAKKKNEKSSCDDPESRTARWNPRMKLIVIIELSGLVSAKIACTRIHECTALLVHCSRFRRVVMRLILPLSAQSTSSDTSHIQMYHILCRTCVQLRGNLIFIKCTT
jgi:hypothetical protein